MHKGPRARARVWVAGEAKVQVNSKEQERADDVFAIGPRRTPVLSGPPFLSAPHALRWIGIRFLQQRQNLRRLLVCHAQQRNTRLNEYLLAVEVRRGHGEVGVADGAGSGRQSDRR